MLKIKTRLLLGLFFVSSLFAQQVLDRIVAIVDDEIILESEVTQMAYMMSMQAGVQPQQNPETFQQFRQQALESFVNKELLLIKAEEDTIEADERQVETYLDQQIASVIQQAGGEDQVEATLGIPLSRLRRSYRDEIRKDLRANMVKQTMLADVEVTRREVKQFYKSMPDSARQLKEAVDISHILIEPKPGEKARMEALEEAQDLRQQILDGADFAKLAREHSDDQQSARRGGDLGFMSREDFVRAYAEAAYNLEPGEVSEVVESEFGYHIIKLEAKRGEKIHTRHILISVEPTRADLVAAADTIKMIHDKLLKGANFDSMVLEYSDDKSTRADRGHLGLYEIQQLQQMASEFVYALEDVKEDHYSEPVRTQYGFHVLKLHSRDKSRELNLERDRDKIEQMALQHKQQQILQDWIDEKKKQVYVEYKN